MWQSTPDFLLYDSDNDHMKFTVMYMLASAKVHKYALTTFRQALNKFRPTALIISTYQVNEP